MDDSSLWKGGTIYLKIKMIDGLPSNSIQNEPVHTVTKKYFHTVLPKSNRNYFHEGKVISQAAYTYCSELVHICLKFHIF